MYLYYLQNKRLRHSRVFYYTFLLLFSVYGGGAKAKGEAVAGEKATTLFFDTVKSIKLADIEPKALGIKHVFPIQNIVNYQINFPSFTPINLQVADYLDNTNNPSRAIIYPASPAYFLNQTTQIKDNATPGNSRHHSWNHLSDLINKHTSQSALFISWWPNSQRIHLMTGRKVWFKKPMKNAYGNEQERSMWREIAGGFGSDERLKIFASALVSPAQEGIRQLVKALNGHKDVFILIASDDLSYLSEMIALSSLGIIPLEMKIFNQPSGNIHTTIAHVKEWASEGNGTGSYMVQKVGESTRLRVWKIIDKTFEDSLLVRMLPFLRSSQGEEINIKLVYQSQQGSFSIYQLAPSLLGE